MLQSGDLLVSQPFLLAYRKDILANLRLPVPETWDQLLQVWIGGRVLSTWMSMGQGDGRSCRVRNGTARWANPNLQVQNIGISCCRRAKGG